MTFDPIADAAEYTAETEDENRVIGYCSHCGREVRLGEDFIEYNGDLWHKEDMCICDFIEHFVEHSTVTTFGQTYDIMCDDFPFGAEVNKTTGGIVYVFNPSVRTHMEAEYLDEFLADVEDVASMVRMGEI